MIRDGFGANAHSVYVITDPGHGWLAVDTRVYPDALDYGTGFGYRSGDWAYLEEDCEAVAFLMDHPEIVRAELYRQDYPRTYAVCRQYPRIPDRLDFDAFMARRRELAGGAA